MQSKTIVIFIIKLLNIKQFAFHVDDKTVKQYKNYKTMGKQNKTNYILLILKDWLTKYSFKR